MNFADERYVRVYTRDTAGWLAMPWQGRALVPLLLRKVDRAGVIDLGDEDPIEVVAALVALPIEVVSVGLQALVRRATIQIGGGTLVVPNFKEAQEATATDKVRQQKSRESRRAMALEQSRQPSRSAPPVSARDSEVTLRDDPSRRAERSSRGSDHVSLLAVPSVPSCDEPSREGVQGAAPSDAGASPPPQLELTPEEPKHKKKTDETRILEAFVRGKRSRDPKYSTEKKALASREASALKAAKKAGYSIETLELAAEGIALDEGRQDKNVAIKYALEPENIEPHAALARERREREARREAMCARCPPLPSEPTPEEIAATNDASPDRKSPEYLRYREAALDKAARDPAGGMWNAIAFGLKPEEVIERRLQHGIPEPEPAICADVEIEWERRRSEIVIARRAAKVADDRSLDDFETAFGEMCAKAAHGPAEGSADASPEGSGEG